MLVETKGMFSILWDQIFITTVVNGDPEKKIPASTGFQ